MAPAKKTKKAADSINSRLALVMKSGKGMSSAFVPHASYTSRHGKHSDRLMITVLSYSGLQVNLEDSSLRQGQACYHRRQHPSTPQERARMYVPASCT